MSTYDRSQQVAAPGGNGAERQLAEQDADLRPPRPQRPDRRPAPGNPPLESQDLERASAQLERVSGH
jgi:hypothetical protein